MPRCYYIWIALIFFLQCASIFDRRNEFEKAVAYYQQSDIEKAIHYFKEYYAKNPFSDTTLYYLHDCYRQQGDINAQILVLERLTDLNTKDIHVYTVLLRYYFDNKEYDRFFETYRSAPVSIVPLLDARYTLTRELYAKLLLGATRTAKWQGDPMEFAVTKGFLHTVITDAYYQDDTMTIGNLIVALDRLLEPTYPKQFYPMSYISERSFLYLPYMRLVDMDILAYERDVDPNRITPLNIAVKAIHAMMQRGYLD